MSAPASEARALGVIVLGGTSQIALAIVRELARKRATEVVLAGRDTERLHEIGRELEAESPIVTHTMAFDARALDTHAGVVTDAFSRLGSVDVVILAVGVLGERGGLPDDVDAAVEVLEVNAVGAGSLLLHSGERLAAQRHGTLVVLSSVAAERPRRANVVYGASKAGLDSLAQGLGDALRSDRVRVLVVRPGFVDTAMTRGLPRPPLSTTPGVVARATVRGLDRGAHTVWAPPAMRWVMLILRLLPRTLFRRLSL